MAQPAHPSNPFDGFDAFGSVAKQPPAPPPQQQQPANAWGQPQQSQQLAPQPVPPQQPEVAANPFGSFNGQAANPFGGATPQQPRGSFGGPQQLPPQQPGTGYPPQGHSMAAPPQPQQTSQRQLVPLAPNVAAQQSPWALAPLQPAQQPPPPVGTCAIIPVAAPPAGASYDPFGVFNAPNTAPPQQHQPMQQSPFNTQPQQQQMQHHQTQQNPYAVDPFQQQPAVQAPTAQQKLMNDMNQFNISGAQSSSMLPDDEHDEALALIDVELDDDDGKGTDAKNLEERKKDGDFLPSARDGHQGGRKSRGSPTSRSGKKNSWDRNPDIAPPPPISPGRRHSEYLAENSAPALSSPLPKHELVHHSGYVLSRISFRTVLMRKWKQTFWIQYGPTQLLFFRTFADYEDWLNNPYHTAKAREFLVKLRVDFVSDLKKSSVMGYQVTQVRRKPYGKNVMLHFKLERWMDYGPTIAAAFAAREEEMMNSPRNRSRDVDGGMNTSNDVASLRKIILGCMRNARDAAASASMGVQADYGDVGMRGRYDTEHERETRVPTSSGNMGYHQAFSAESSERRRAPAQADDASDVGTEESLEEAEVKRETKAHAPIIDLLG